MEGEKNWRGGGEKKLSISLSPRTRMKVCDGKIGKRKKKKKVSLLPFFSLHFFISFPASHRWNKDVLWRHATQGRKKRSESLPWKDVSNRSSRRNWLHCTHEGSGRTARKKAFLRLIEKRLMKFRWKKTLWRTPVPYFRPCSLRSHSYTHTATTRFPPHIRWWRGLIVHKKNKVGCWPSFPAPPIPLSTEAEAGLTVDFAGNESTVWGEEIGFQIFFAILLFVVLWQNFDEWAILQKKIGKGVGSDFYDAWITHA